MNYLKRVSSYAARPERSEYKIGLFNCSAIPTLDELSIGLEILRANGYTTLVFNPEVDLDTTPALYI